MVSVTIIKRFLCLASFLLLSSHLLASDPDDSWIPIGSRNGPTGAVYTAAAFGNTVYMGGSFTAMGGLPVNYVAQWNGQRWTALGSGLNGYVRGLTVDKFGHLYAVGDFTMAGGVSASRIAKWDGSQWSALGSGLDATAYAVAADNNGNVYVGGVFTAAGGIAASRIARWDGKQWTSLGAGVNAGVVKTLVVDPTGNVYVGGDSFTSAGGVTASRVAKWDGSSWSAMGSGLTGGSVNAMAFDAASGTLYVGGAFTALVGGGAMPYLARWQGGVWSTVGSGVSSRVDALVLSPSGLLYAGGIFSSVGGVASGYIASWNGTAWSPLSSGLHGDNPLPAGLAVDASGKLYVGGTSFVLAGSIGVQNVAQWNGTDWSAIGEGMNGQLRDILFMDNGDMVIAGHFSTVGGVSNTGGIARWDGSQWHSIGGGFGGQAFVMARDSQGNIYAGGAINTAGGVNMFGVVKWDGNSWSKMGTFYNTVTALAVDSANNVYAATSSYDGATYGRIFKWNGSAWSKLGGGTNSQVHAIACDDNGNVYVGGQFTATATTPNTNYIAKWNGSTWSALGTGMNAMVKSLAVDADGYLYAGGIFTVAGGVPANMVAKWDGTSWSALGAGMNHQVLALQLGPDNTIYAGGPFTMADGQLVNGITRWDGTGWSPMGSGVEGCYPSCGGSVVNTLELDSTGALFVGGDFNNAGGNYSPYLAKWDADSDDDGVSNDNDVFPSDPSEWSDNDQDGVGDNADNDDDNDHKPDHADCTPLEAYLDCSFRGNGKSRNPNATTQDTVAAVVEQADGKLLVAGTRDATGQDVAVTRFLADGTVDTAFGSGGTAVMSVGSEDDVVADLLPQPDGSILVAGASSNGGNRDFTLVKYTSTGATDTAFATEGVLQTAIGSADDVAQAMVQQADGRIVLAGYAEVGGDDEARTDFALVRYLPDGTLDTGFSGDGKVTTDIGADADKAYAVLQQTDGKLVTAGIAYVASELQLVVVRYLPDGTLDSGFGSGGKVTTAIGMAGEHPVSLLQQADGKLVVASTGSVEGDTAFVVVRYHPDGALDDAFSGDGIQPMLIGSSTAEAHSLLQQADGKLVVAGSSNNGSDRNVQKNKVSVIRYHADGALDTDFGVEGILATDVSTSNDYGHSLLQQADGKFVVAGTANDNADTALVRYEMPDSDADGVADSLDVFPDDPAESLDTDHDGIGNYADWDDDGDGVLDALDTDPLNAGEAGELALPLDGLFKGSRIQDSQMAP